MSAYAGPAPTLTSKSGWARVALSSGRAFLVYQTPAGACTCMAEQPSVARDAAGRPQVALTLVLARMPAITDASIAPFVIGGSLALSCSLAIARDDLAALEAHLGMNCSPLFIRSGSAQLRDAAAVYAQSSLLGSAARFWLGTFLPAQQALDALRSFEKIQSELYVDTRVEGDPAPGVPPVALDALLGGVLDGLDRGRYISMIVPQADGTAATVPTVIREIPQAGPETRDLAGPLPMAAADQRLVALPFAMTPSTAVRPSAAALAAGGATGPATHLTPNAQHWLGNDAIILTDGGTNSSDGGTPDTPTEQLPLFTAPDAPFWADAVDPAAAWYPPSFVPVMPAANDDPRTAAYTFEFSRSSSTLGSGGIQAGLTSTVRITVDEQMPAATTQALASAGSMTPHPVPLGNLSVSLEIPYRQTGSATPITQRFPGTVTQNGTRLTISVPLLDDWVRLAYNALAYPPASGFPAPRLIIDYAFTAYQWVPVGGVQVVYGGKLAQLASVASRDQLPQNLTQPTLIPRDLLVVGPRSYLQYRQEGPVPRALPASALALPLPSPSTSILVDRPTLFPPVVLPHPRLRRLMTRSIVREEAVDLQFPCASLGALYLQVAEDGVTKTSVGCQDALKLGETGAKAFEEIVPLRASAYRVYRSLQQPGRFLVVPAAYRVGRYASSEGPKAFRPIILLYGVLDPDPAKNRYVLAATLIADVSPYQLALLQDALRAYTPAGSAPAVALPTDPYVGASITYAWTVPGGLDQPTALNVLDTFNVLLSMAMDQAALLTTMINQSGIQGKVTFALPDGTDFDAALVIDGDVIGPPDTGPVTAELGGSTITLANRTQQAMNVPDIATVNAGGSVTVTQVNVALAPGATSSQPAPPAATRAVASATAADHPALNELDIFIEDVTMTVTFIDQINFANHGLTALAIQARLNGSNYIQEASLPEGATATLNFTLPITTYLTGHTLQYALKKTNVSGTTTTAWRDWDLNKGTVIGITADLL